MAVAVATVSSLYELCRELADAVELALEQSPAGAIPNSFVSPALPAFDCPPMIAVHAGGPVEADTAPLAPPLQPGERIEVGAVNLISVTATVIRCVTGLKTNLGRAMLPSTAEIEDDAKAVLGDVWTIWNRLSAMKRNGELFPPKDRKMFFDPAVPVPAQGAAAGWQMQFRVELGGIPKNTWGP